MLALAFFFLLLSTTYLISFFCSFVDVFICETVCIAVALAGNVHFINRIKKF